MSQTQRMPLIDAFKAIASQLIVLHHLSSYGPLAATARELLPGTLGWLYDYARMAVQVFLVIGGFLAARGLSANGQALAGSPLPLLWKRYLRLVIPFLAAIAIAVVCSAVADRWMDDTAIPERATLSQWLAHVALLQGVLGVASLSAGVWYVAIDFQLFALMVLLLWIGRRNLVAPALVLAAAVASLFWFNRDTGWNNWALYFFGSYGLGAAAWWASDRRRLAAWLGVITTVTIAALVVDFRLRIALALGIALTLGFSRRGGLLERWPDFQPLAFLGRISYSVFLVHFPILLLTNGLFTLSGLESPAAAIAVLVLTWAASIAAGLAFYRWIESPAANRRITAALGWLAGRLRETSRQAWRLLRHFAFGRG
ncbi:acyltransferase [Azonexus sp.]|jgi:peptidoglycan/LPS O-acetylase OafA/YrhL|uniref:acyltransferase family protein n=1 Tax=Azonexus sp. TaxID=1872668 RepID=UPI00282EBF20|nr:acyltransferase [Azonexus sp.]MDR1994199.1 acyltransferase [Azonexus sp.]